VRRETVEAAMSMGHCDHVRPQELVNLWDALAAAQAEVAERHRAELHWMSVAAKAQAEVAELRRELEQQRELAKHRGDCLVKQLDATLAMRRAKEDAESRACTPAERRVLEACGQIPRQSLLAIAEQWPSTGELVSLLLARRATREQPAKGCVHSDFMRGMVCDECAPAPVSSAKEGDEC